MNLSVNQPPEFAFSASHQDTTIIGGNSFVLAKDLQVSGGTGDYIYHWSPLATLSDFAIMRPVAQPTDTTDYLLTVADGNGCSFSVNYKVNVVQPDQSIDLKSGWNIISFNVIPWNLNMKIVGLSLINDGSMVKVQDETGNSLEDYGVFGGWVNNISDIGVTEGYKVKVTRNCQLHVIGPTPVFPLKIPLKSGWNIIGFPHKTERNAEAVVQQLIDRQTLVKAQDELGNALEDYGYFGGWTNNIGNFKPGRGYKIKLNAADTLIIFESYPKSSASPMSHEPTVHFKPVTQGNGVDHMNINVVGIPASLLGEGDEIGVFDGDLCVGSLVISNRYSVISNRYSVISNQYSVIGDQYSVNGQKSQITNHKSLITNQAIPIRNPQSAIRNLSIHVSASDGPDCPGFTEGHQIVLRVWKAAEMKEYEAKTELISGTSTFLKHESVFVSLKNLKMDGKTGTRIFPNPSSGKVYIQADTNDLTGIRVLVFNTLGQQVISKVINANPEVIDFSGFVSGVYTIRILGDDWSKTEKVILK